jgi:hypothetical protein
MGHSQNSFPSRRKCDAPLISGKVSRTIPYYTADGRSRGFRSLECVERLIGMGLAVPVYGRRGHLRAIFEYPEDGGTVIRSRLPIGARYSFREHLDNGRLCWRLRRIGRGNELRPVFLQVVTECLVWHRAPIGTVS